MRFLLSISLLLLAANSAYAQKFGAQIIDKFSSQPIPGVKVQVVETGISITSDSLGIVNFPNVAFSTITVNVQHQGYITFTNTFECSSENHPLHVIELEPSHKALEEIQIVSVRVGNQQDVITHVESKKVSELNTIGRMNLMEGIGTMPGVQTMSTGIGIGKPVIRGLSGSRVVTYLQGIRYENQQWGSDHGLGITDLGISNVEIIKGPSSLLFGADALGGVLFLVDEDYANLGETEVTLSSMTESVNNYIGTKVWAKSSGQKLRFAVGGGFNSGSDYQVPTGEFVKSSYFQDRYGRIMLNWSNKKFVHNIKYSVQQSFVGIPGHSHDSVIHHDDLYSNATERSFRTPRQEIITHVASWQTKVYFRKSSLDLNVGWNYNQLTELEEKVTVPAIRLNTNSFPYTLKWKISAPNSFQFNLGIQGMVQSTQNAKEAEEQIVPNSATNDIGLFAVANKRLGKLNLQAGLRSDLRQIEILDDSKSRKQFSSLTGSIGAHYKNKRHTFRTNFSSGFRAPTVYELVANGLHHGSSRYEIGNSDLTVESSMQLDFAYEFGGEHIALIFNPFISSINNYILLQASDSTIDNFRVYNYVQVNNALLTGFDAGIHLHPHFAHFLHLESAYSYLYTDVQSTHTALDLTPQNRLISTLKFVFSNSGKFKFEQIALEHQLFQKASRVALNETESGAYQLLNLGIKFSYKTEKLNLSLNMGMKNILNEAYIPHISQLKYLEVYQPGRSIYAQFILHFKNK